MLQIHERIKNERIKKRLTEDEVADMIGVRRTTYQYWEKKTPGIDKIKRIAKALGLPDDYFFINNDEAVKQEDSINNPEAQILANLREIRGLAAAIIAAQEAEHKVMLGALERLEGRPEGQLSDIADKLTLMIQRRLQMGIHEPGSRNSVET